MPKFGVTLITDAYYEVEAVDTDDAIAQAFELLYGTESLGTLYWDCNEAVELDFE